MKKLTEMKDRNRILYISGIISTVLLISLIFYLKTAVTAPVFSEDSGFYDSEFELEIKCLNPDLDIFYTTDGTVPDQNALRYTGPVKIYDYSVNDNIYSARTDIAFEEGQYGYVWTPEEKIRKAMVIRAVACNRFGQSSGIVTKTYFVGGEGYTSYGDTPVLSITTDPDNLFGHEKGIYVWGKTYDDWYEKNRRNIEETVWGYPSNFQEKGKQWEREAQLEIIKDGSQVLEQDVGIRVRGGSTRFFEQKSFSIYARKEYGNHYIKHSVFPENKSRLNGTVIEQYDSFIIRNWGNNWRTYMLIDPLVQTLVKDRYISTQYSQPCVLFLNGEYWGLYDMKEKYGEEYFKQHYGIDEDNLIMVKDQATGDRSGRAIEIGRKEDIAEYEKLEEFVKKNDFSVSSNYETICDMVDIDSFIDLYAVRMYVEAVDFPKNNSACWRTRVTSDKPYQDGKWRWMLYDVDPDLRYPNYYNGFELSMTGSEMFSGLMKNDRFRQKFVTTVCDLMNENFNYRKVEKELSALKNKCKPYILEYYKRYGPEEIRNSDEDKSKYYETVNDSILEFFAKQGGYILNLLKEEGLVSGEVHTLKAEWNKALGRVIINSAAPEPENFVWQGKYYSDFPVKLTAASNDGRQFCGWYDEEGNLISSDRMLQLDMAEDIAINAQFR